MLAVWRLHGLDSILREAWQQGTILCGWSAGALCWFEGGSTDSFGRDLSVIDNCLGFLPGSYCPHYDSEECRRPTYHRFIAEGLPGGWASDDGAALPFEGRELRRVIGSREGARAYRVEKAGSRVQETPIDPERLW
jgi:peptidase E